MVIKFLHWLAHLTGSNEGRIATWLENGQVMVGFQCTKCGIIEPKTIVQCKIKEVEINHE